MRLAINISEHDWQWIANGVYIPQEINRIISEAIMKGIILPEDHGRLIDADAFKKYIMDGFEENKGLFKTKEYRDLARSTAISFCKDIDEQETVIPADEEENK